MMPRLLLAMFALCATIALPFNTARAQALSADLSDHLIAINTAFTGTGLTLFGSTDGDGDVAVVVEGPRADLMLRKKENIAGIWTNGESARFVDAPTFYYAAATREPSQFLREAPRSLYRIGVNNLPLDIQDVDDENIAEFRTAFIADRANAGLYNRQVGNVTFIGSRLFRSDIYFPANVPTGTYAVKVMLIRGGEVIAQTDTPLTIRKVGTSARIFNFAHDYSAVFGLMAVVCAAAIGWFAAFVFRKN